MRYEHVTISFIERTQKLLEQYDELVMNRVDEKHQFEVTLLLNCLMGLLVFPQQLAIRDQKKFGQWLTQDLVKEVGSDWGIAEQNVQRAGHRLKDDKPIVITFEQLTIRNLIRQMRNCIAHASLVAESEDKEGKAIISKVVFKAGDDSADLHFWLPVSNLRLFANKIADSAIAKL